MKRITTLNIMALALLSSLSLVVNSASAATVGVVLGVESADTIRQTDTIYVHVPVTVFDNVHDTLYNPVVFDTAYLQLETLDLSVSVDSTTPYGKVSGNGSFPENTEVEIAAIADRGFRFVRWDDGNTDNPRTVVVEGKRHFVATFDSLAGSPSTPAPAKADTVIFTDTVIVYVYDTTFVGSRDTVYVTPHDTVWLDSIPYYTLLVLSGDEGRGVVAGNGYFPHGTVVEIAALPLPDFRFVHWHDNNRDNPRRILMDDVQILVADFAPDTATHDDPDPDPDPEPWNPVLKYHVAGLTLTVTSPASEAIRIFTAEGRLVAASEPTGDRLTEAVRSFRLPANGIYLVQVGPFPVKRFVLFE